MGITGFIMLVVNCFVFMIYGLDKYYAKKKKYRISEKRLLFVALLGPVGALFGIYLWRHKTRKWYFPTVAWIGFICQLIVFFMIYQNEILMVF